MTCPYCGHAWDMHAPRCTQCGCMWSLPKPLPRPPTERELLIGRVCEAMFDELDDQHEEGEIDAAGYWDREWGRLDGEPNWGRVAEAAIKALEER